MRVRSGCFDSWTVRVTEGQSVLQKRSKRQARDSCATKAHSECRRNLSGRVALRNFSRDKNFEEQGKREDCARAVRRRNIRSRFIASNYFLRGGFRKEMPQRRVALRQARQLKAHPPLEPRGMKRPAALCDAAEVVLCSGCPCSQSSEDEVQAIIRGDGQRGRHESQMKNLSYNRFLPAAFWVILARTVTFLARPEL